MHKDSVVFDLIDKEYARQKRGIACCIVDKHWMKALCACGLEHGGPNAGRPQFYQDIIDGMAAIQPGSRGNVLGCTVAERMGASVLCDGSADEVKAAAKAYDELQNSIDAAAARGVVDQIIAPEDVRKFLIGAVEMLYSKREALPSRKHASI